MFISNEFLKVETLLSFAVSKACASQAIEKGMFWEKKKKRKDYIKATKGSHPKPRGEVGLGIRQDTQLAVA